MGMDQNEYTSKRDNTRIFNKGVALLERIHEMELKILDNMSIGQTHKLIEQIDVLLTDMVGILKNRSAKKVLETDTGETIEEETNAFDYLKNELEKARQEWQKANETTLPANRRKKRLSAYNRAKKVFEHHRQISYDAGLDFPKEADPGDLIFGTGNT